MYDPMKPYKEGIRRLIQETWQTPYLTIRGDLYPVFGRKFSFPEVDHTDGIGTKGIYHWQKRTFKNAALDALAMNLNDLALVRATPYKLQDHITLPEDDEEAVFEIVETLVGECKKRGIAMTGGETSIHEGSSGLDISITISGFIKNPKPNQFQVGDVLVGLPSNGLHSNGFTKVREIFGDEVRSEFVVPTQIYLDQILKLNEDFDIHGMMHITGGAFTKLKDLLHVADAIITRNHTLKPQPIFQELYKHGISDKEMYRTFNCGIGFVLSTAPRDAEKVAAQLEGEVIGEITSGTGAVHVESMFSKQKVSR